jgi:hypothetical protein
MRSTDGGGEQEQCPQRNHWPALRGRGPALTNKATAWKFPGRLSFLEHKKNDSSILSPFYSLTVIYDDVIDQGARI